MTRVPKYDQAFVDKLKIVFHKHDVDGGTADGVKSVLDDLVSAERATRISAQAKGFSNRYRVPISDRGDAMIVEVTPNNPSRTDWHMAWEFNPAKLFKEERVALRMLFCEILGTGHQRLLANACLKEVHIAIDFKQNISEVAIEAVEKSVCVTYGKRFGDHGLLQTLYFGSSQSDHHLTAYNKEAELLAAYASRPDVTVQMVKDKVDKNRKRLRLEDRQRLSRNPVPLHRLADLREPFAGFHVYSYAESESELDPDNSLHRVTLELAKERGLQAAIKLLSKSERETMRKALARCQVEWWDARLYANAVTSALKAINLFPDFAFDLAEREGSHAETLYVERKAKQKAGATDFRVNGDGDEEDED